MASVAAMIASARQLLPVFAWTKPINYRRQTARKTTNHVHERDSAEHVRDPMVHLISQLRKAAEDRFGSTAAVPGTKKLGPVLFESAISLRLSPAPSMFGLHTHDCQWQGAWRCVFSC